MKKKLLLLIAILMFIISGCSLGSSGPSDDEIFDSVKKANVEAMIDEKHDSVSVDVKKYDAQHYSIYNDSISSEYNSYLEDMSLMSMEVCEKEYIYGYNSDGIYYTNVNLTGEYDRYRGVYSYDWDRLVLKNIQKSSGNFILSFVVDDESMIDYLREYGLNAEEIEKVDVIMIANGDDYSMLYRSDVAAKTDKSTVTLAEFEYRYNEENPEKQMRADLDEHYQKADKYRIVTVYTDPDTTIEQLATYKVPAGDKFQLLLEKDYRIDTARSVLSNKDNNNDMTYYLVNDKNKDLIIKKEDKKQDSKNEPKELTDGDFVVLTDIVPDVILEIRYHSTYNFVGERIDGYDEPTALITYKAALALKEVSDELAQSGYRLKIFDAYRPTVAEDHFVRWSKDLNDTKMKDYFYPEINKEDLFKLGYVAERSGHGRGSTFDLTLFDIETGKELDMGTPFDYFSEKSHPDYRNLTEEQFNNRMLLRDVMVKHGFRPFYGEWWHFTLDNEPYPDTYFSFPVSRSSLDNQTQSDQR